MIQTNLDVIKPEREYIINKIDQITKELYVGQAPKVEMFGSLSTGLALESSDMDLAVTGLQLDDRYVMIENMQKLAGVL